MHRAVAALAEDQQSCDWLDLLGRDLYALNREAVRQRYGTADPVPEYRFRPPGDVPKVQLYKSLRCLLYQCSEGDVPETALYRRVEERANGLAREIVGG